MIVKVIMGNAHRNILPVSRFIKKMNKPQGAGHDTDLLVHSVLVPLSSAASQLHGEIGTILLNTDETRQV